MESRLKTYELWIRRLWSIVYGLGSANEFMHMLIHENFKKLLHIEMLVKRCSLSGKRLVYNQEITTKRFQPRDYNHEITTMRLQPIFFHFLPELRIIF